MISMLVLSLTGCGSKKENGDSFVGTWSGESTNEQMCTLTFTNDGKFKSECTGAFNKVYEVTGTYKVKDNVVTIISSETNKETQYEYEVKEAKGALKKRISLIAIDSSVSYEDFEFED